ncbi:GNAT family N-acetyltransferase [uncultured Alistipes sp.]|uniref:GNAT family N-acetyltransferase n=1 Tax=uncultured Alistipes sp. TaxID=538949 RepID=UPI00259787A3|nr:GNAT family N-acetyltransferase [uncultured Alistipes sp.]
METRILKTDTPPWELLLLGDESPESVADYIDRGDCYVATAEGRTVGVCMLIRTHPFTAEIVNLAVDPAYQRRGIGTDLIFHALRVTREAGCRRIEIATGSVENGPLRLYRSFGFEPVETERDYFPKYYPALIVEAGEECRDLVRLRMEL